MTAPTLADLLAASRIFALRTAVVARLKTALPFCEVKAHPGRLDVGDVEDGTMFSPPGLYAGVTRLNRGEGRMSGHRDVPVEIAVYVVAGDTTVAGQLVTRDEVALALSDAVLAIVEAAPGESWGLTDISPPENADAQALFTAKSHPKAILFYAVTWRQVLMTLGDGLWDFESTPDGLDPTVLLPGDPGWTPPGMAP